jgi:hypothetical protein
MTTRAMIRTMQAAILGVVAAMTAVPAMAQDDCGTAPSPLEAAALQQQEAAGAYALPAMPLRHIFSVPLTIHIVRQSDGTGGTPIAEVDASIDVVNNHWRAAGIEFFHNGTVDYIDNDTLFGGANGQAAIDSLKQINPVGNTINVYFTPSVSDATGGLCGQASFTTTAIQGIVMSDACTNDDGNTTSFAHELGHYLDLFHTHETVLGLECPNGSNCTTAGDLLCDTPADPTLANPGMLTGCTYSGTGTRCGQVFNPNPANIMASNTGCRTLFTEGQRLRALATLVNLRPNLITGGALFVTWVDFNYAGSSNGSFNQPYRDLWTANQVVADGGTIVVKGGLSGQTATYTRRCTIDSFRGPAVIGN